ncbi:hypothetical protein SAMN02799630_03806 [Paenibacillus sp. UNCCL117]|uniref:GAP1-N2 domain-containing protein n=1 Tax=unclassified Paenibacillus TaxID=185978 RepID=UPI00088BC181|nr:MULTISPECIES: cadherin-like beta sandwich domain-containing protein [unclassified Paenibacillus]SDD59336.1 hypothetical protein SAMN04488602_110131 [Paenibacillus sp. cl123]SFW50835.1 hypothetical protein SAMN02799630_03806 [Paenibacillus sp. UNCCL117]
MIANGQRSIQQHYFTRAREGVFRTNEGFDTVAASPGLDALFIKSALHPYCYYKGPREKPDGAEGAEYPAALAVYHADNGDLVVGQTVYVPADFTGQRSAFFTHQYVVPAALKDEWVRYPERIFATEQFAVHHDARLGKELPELQEPPTPGAAASPEPDQLLAGLGLTRDSFEQLLVSVMASVTNRRKVYIVLDGEPAQAERDARQLMRLLWSCMPYAFRRRLGVLTFAGEAEGKQHLHVTFLEKGALRQSDRQLEREMVFDLSAGKLAGAEPAAVAGRWLETIWTLREEPERLQALFDFCEQALAGLEPGLSLSLSSYEELCTLFTIEQGGSAGDALYDADRARVWRSLGTYLKGETQETAKTRLHELVVRLLRLETGDVKRAGSPQVIDAMLGCEAYAERGERALLCRTVALFVMRAASAGDTAATAPLLEPIQRQPELFRSVFRELSGLSPRTAESCASYAIGRADNTRVLQSALAFWLTNADMLSLNFFAGETVAAVKRLLAKEGAARKVDTGAALFRFFDELSEQRGLERYADYCELLKLEIQLMLLEEVPLAELEAEHVSRLGFMLDPPAPELLPHLSKGHRLTLELWAAVYRVLTLERGGEAKASAALAKLGPLELERAQAFLRGVWRNGMPRTAFSGVAYSFYRGGAEHGGWGSFDFDPMLDYVAESADSKETVYAFIEWSASDERFTGPSGGIDPHYRAALNRYFDRYDSGALRQKPVRQRLMAIGNPAFVALFREINTRQAPSWQRLLWKRRKPLILAALLAAALLIVLPLIWTPVGAFITRPVPELQVAELPERTSSDTITVKAQAADNYDRMPKIYVNGVLAGQGEVSREVVLAAGINTITVKAENKYGRSPETVTRTVILEPAIGPKLPPPAAAGPTNGAGGAAGSDTARTETSNVKGESTPPKGSR